VPANTGFLRHLGPGTPTSPPVFDKGTNTPPRPCPAVNFNGRLVIIDGPRFTAKLIPVASTIASMPAARGSRSTLDQPGRRPCCKSAKQMCSNALGRSRYITRTDFYFHWQAAGQGLALLHPCQVSQLARSCADTRTQTPTCLRDLVVVFSIRGHLKTTRESTVAGTASGLYSNPWTCSPAQRLLPIVPLRCTRTANGRDQRQFRPPESSRLERS
jgi:hypothetical protein